MLHEIQLPEVKKIESKGNTGVFSIEPLHPGYGMTLGNSLRRVLLSSLEGSAVTSIKIEGVLHEFSTIPNIKEDVVEIIMNIKKLRVKSLSDESEYITLSKTGVGKVTAADIKTNQNVEVLNPDLHIATLDNKNAKLDMELKIDKGRGYVTVEKRKKEKLGVGFIALDALYSPTRRVRYSVESTRVGQMTNLDKLILEIETDGTMTPEEALSRSAEILVDHFLVISGKESVELKKPEVNEEESESASAGIMVEEINLSPRTTNALLNNDLKTVDDILKRSFDELKNLKGFGAKAYDEVIEKLDELGLLKDKKEIEDKEEKDA
ncbi:DNA-directed RNA polymerase subunit alpha [candidate division WS5 bacterium]|uniref:DNA-directed RNA polymerase subunit alpha n=1 Tax=candidate division WS5 bacterium TaxID=2093353 RepID=A0A419DA83_9BACT|nr:MAG: DNA-directed RNA polymerase subunit alpha [candidate division WS5 bacterium]